MKLSIALPKGRLGHQSFDYFFSAHQNPFNDRQLLYEDKTVKILWVKPSDVITYVVKGVVDFGIVGEDTLDEYDPEVYRLKKLPYGVCQLVVAGVNHEDLHQQGHLKVATKYPRLSRRYFQTQHQKIELLPLQGSVELAPLVGLSDVIVDIVETGATLKANGLKILDVIQSSQAIAFANKARYRFQQRKIEALLEASERNDHA